MNGHGENRELYFSFTSFLQPPAIYRYDLDARNTVPWRETRPDTSLAQFETTQLFFTSKDGTRVPMFITARRGIKLDGSHPRSSSARESCFRRCLLAQLGAGFGWHTVDVSNTVATK